MLNLTHAQHLAQHFGDFDRSGTDQNGSTCIDQALDLFDDCFVLFAFCFVNTVVHVFTGNRTVGRDYHNIQFVDVPEFACFCFGCTGHTRKFMVHTEVVLQRNGCKSLGGSFYFHTFFCFDGLMESVGITASFHDTSCLFVYNLNLSVYHNIFIVLFEHGICFQQLVDGMYAFRFDRVVVQ